MADRKLNIDVILDSADANKGLSELEKKGNKSAKNIGANYKQLGSTMTASFLKAQLAFAALMKVGKTFVDVGKQAVANFQAQETAVNKLNTAFKSQGIFTEESSKAFQNWASEIQSATNIGDEALIELGAELADLSRLGGEDLQKLTKATISFAEQSGKSTDTVKRQFAEMAASGDWGKLEKQLGLAKGSILSLDDAVNATSAGFAQLEAGTQTSAGMVTRLKNAWGDFLEPLGGFLSNAPFVKEALSFMSSGLEEFTKIMNGGEADPDSWVGKMQAAFQSLNETVAPVFTWLSEAWTKFTTTGSEENTKLKEVVTEVSKFFADMWADIEPIWKTLKENWQVLVEFIQAFWDEHGEKIMTAFKAVWDTIVVVFKQTWDTVVLLFKTSSAIFQGVFEVFTSILKGDWAGAWEAIKETGKTIWEAIEVYFRETFENFSEYFGKIWTGIKTTFINLWDDVKEKTIEKFGSVVEWIETKVGAIKGFFDGLYTYVVGNSVWPDMWDEMEVVTIEKTEIINGYIRSLKDEFASIEQMEINTPTINYSPFVNTTDLNTPSVNYTPQVRQSPGGVWNSESSGATDWRFKAGSCDSGACEKQYFHPFGSKGGNNGTSLGGGGSWGGSGGSGGSGQSITKGSGFDLFGQGIVPLLSAGFSNINGQGGFGGGVRNSLGGVLGGIASSILPAPFGGLVGSLVGGLFKKKSKPTTKAEALPVKVINFSEIQSSLLNTTKQSLLAGTIGNISRLDRMRVAQAATGI